MAAAIQIFSQKGYHNSKMEDIALAAGIGKGTIYEYFPGKLQLLQEIMEQSFHLYDHSLAAELNNSLSFETKIKVLLEGHFRFCQQNKDLTRFMFWDTEVIDEELMKWGMEKRAEKEGRLQEMIREGIGSGEIRDLDPKLITVMISGVFSALWIPVVVEGWEVDAAQAAAQITDMLMQGLKH
jgi:AcrR family transcriptional regulator